ncbi:MAG: tRNA lysidine(34) synthetase TilS [Ruminococcaceae bacterium]|nr:tRNA lysidine(34) synthetase TilS [Oscillospiraceae bacterium]
MMTDTVKYSLPKCFTSPHTLSGTDASTPVLAAFSGGSDSSALLMMLCEYAKVSGTKIYAAHVNHMLRGEEADRDEQFCRETAKRLGVELFVCKRDVRAYAEQSGKSIETAARDVRYEFFEKVMREHSIPLLATAHNANDNLETMIFNMVRGCGLDGMCGIPETRSMPTGTVVRPILRMSKREILDYCRENSLDFVTDSTNTDTDYTRNKIRAEIIPALCKINDGAIENASRLAVTLKNDALCISSLTDWFLEELNDDCSIETEKLLGSPAAVSNRAIMAIYKSVSDGKTLEYTHIEAIRELCRGGAAHSSIQLPSGIDARIEQGRLCFIKRSDAPTPPEDFEVKLCEGKNEISQINAEIIIGNSQITKNIYKKSTLLYFASAKICGDVVARNRRAGDKILLNGVNKSVKKLLCDKKIPLDVRYRLPVICDNSGIIAIPFVAVSDRARHKDNEGTTVLRFDLN